MRRAGSARPCRGSGQRRQHRDRRRHAGVVRVSRCAQRRLTPITVDPGRKDYNANFASLVGKLAAGVSADQRKADAHLRSDLRGVAQKMARNYAARARRAAATPAHARDPHADPAALRIGQHPCSSPARTRILMPTMRRGRAPGEIAVRAAMGAERLRIVRQPRRKPAPLTTAASAAFFWPSGREPRDAVHSAGPSAHRAPGR